MCCVQIISGLDAGITAIFAAEALLKIIAFTFTAYIRVNSNKVIAHCRVFVITLVALKRHVLLAMRIADLVPEMPVKLLVQFMTTYSHFYLAHS